MDETNKREETAEQVSSNFIHNIIDRDLENQAYGGRVYTRFPPEPNVIFILVMQNLFA